MGLGARRSLLSRKRSIKFIIQCHTLSIIKHDIRTEMTVTITAAELLFMVNDIIKIQRYGLNFLVTQYK